MIQRPSELPVEDSAIFKFLIDLFKSSENPELPRSPAGEIQTKEISRYMNQSNV